MSRPKLYPTLLCPNCNIGLRCHKATYHDCSQCDGHFREIDGVVVQVERRGYKAHKAKVESTESYMSADEYERLVG